MIRKWVGKWHQNCSILLDCLKSSAKRWVGNCVLKAVKMLLNVVL